jgi:hypothetical protein
MAFADGDMVAARRPASSLGMSYPQPNLQFGVVAAAGPPVIVLYEGGQLTSVSSAAGLDRIQAPAVATDFEQGQVVRPIDCECADYDGVILNIYARDPQGAGVELGTFALVSLLNGLGLMEFLLTELRVLEGGV